MIVRIEILISLIFAFLLNSSKSTSSNEYNEYKKTKENYIDEKTNGAKSLEDRDDLDIFQAEGFGVGNFRVSQILEQAELLRTQTNPEELSTTNTSSAENTTKDTLNVRLPSLRRMEEIDGKRDLPGNIEAEINILNRNPLIFEVDALLEEDEADILLKLARMRKMKTLLSKAPNLTLHDPMQLFRDSDYNDDGYITPEEMTLLPDLSDIYLETQDLQDMMDLSQVDKDQDERISQQEMNETDFTVIKSFLLHLKHEAIEKKRDMTSQTTWMWPDRDELLKYEDDGYFSEWHERLQAVTSIPLEITSQSEPLQIRKFSVGQFQRTRRDSEPNAKEVPCCTYGDERKCRICRYISYHIFLTDEQGGGSLIFPLANHSYEDFMSNSGEWRGYFTYAKSTLGKNSFSANLTLVQEGASQIVRGNGTDDNGEFDIVDGTVLGTTIRFEKRYRVNNNDRMRLLYSGKIVEGTKITGKWWVPGEMRLRGSFFAWNHEYAIFTRKVVDAANTASRCSSSGLAIKPKKGKAVFWYNHHLDERTGMMGDLNLEAMPGICPVTSGELWTASGWVNVIGDGATELRDWKSGSNWLAARDKEISRSILEKLGTSEAHRQHEEHEHEYEADNERGPMPDMDAEADDERSRSSEYRAPESHTLRAMKVLLEGMTVDEVRAFVAYVQARMNWD